MRKEVLTVGILFLLAAEMNSTKTSNQSNPSQNDWAKNSTKKLGQNLKDTDLDQHTLMQTVKEYEDLLESTDFNQSENFYSENRNVIVYIFQPNDTSGNITLFGSDDMADSDSSDVPNKSVNVTLPEDLAAEIGNNSVVFCLMKSPTQFPNFSKNLLIGLSVSGMNVSNLKSPVRISVQVDNPDNRKLTCVFYNWTSSRIEGTGCQTVDTEEDWVDCLCDHLTYFGVLMGLPEPPKQDQINLNYITLIGCSLSLFFLAVIVLLYFIKWRAQSDHSQKIHLSLVVALLLLNLHHLMIDYAVNVYTACVYVAVLLHYSLMATFTWTAIEGFHLYLLFLRVFNIYIRKYLLKLSLVGWGLPAVVVTLIFIIDKTVYLHVGLSHNQRCYINNAMVKYCTTIGYFSVIFAFNLSMLVVVVRNVCCQRFVLPDPNWKRKTKNTCTVLGITCLLGISWSLSFFGYLSKVGTYLFCVFNPLLGFFIFIWFCIYKCTPSGSQTNVDTHKSTTVSSVN